MFSKLALIAATGFAVLAVATPTGGKGQCATGGQYCCNSIQNSSSPSVLALLGSVGGTAGANIPVGVTCTPVTVIGAAAGSSCTQQPVCCNGNNFNGVVVVGCTPLSL